MDNTFQLSIVAEDKSFYQGRASYLSAATSSGSIGFEANHENFAAPLLTDSSISFRTAEGESLDLKIGWGVLLFHDNKCTITFA